MTPALGPRHERVLGWLPTRRRKEGVALAEGERVVSEALRGAWEVEALLLPADDEGPQYLDLQDLARTRGTEIFPLNARAFAKITALDSPPGVAALVRPTERQRLGSGAPPPERLLVLDRLQDPGNAGALVRSAAAFGFATVLVAGGVRLTNEKFIRATSGLCFQAGAVLEAEGPAELGALLQAHHFQCFTLDPHRGETLEQTAAPAGAVALVLGEEAHGVDAAAWAEATPLRIPMAPAVESLNVAVSGAIALHHFRPGGLR